MSSIISGSSSSHCIQAIVVVGGFLDGLNLHFDPRLNCIIGGRGTGKTSLLELVRYALDGIPEDSEAQKRVRALVTKNLGSGRIELQIGTAGGMSHFVSRANNDPPIIMDAKRRPTALTLKSGALFKADIFSQNEVESIADRSDSQLGLIDSFEATTITDLSHRTSLASREISVLSKGVSQVQAKIGVLKEETNELPGVEEQLKSLVATGTPDSRAIHQGHTRKALADRETRAIQRIQEPLSQYDRSLSVLRGILPQQALSAFPADLLQGPNQAILSQVHQAVVDAATLVDQHLNQALEALHACQGQVQGHADALAKVHAKDEMAFRKLIEKQNVEMCEATKRSQLEKRRNDLLAKMEELAIEEEKLTRLEWERDAKFQELSQLRRQRFEKRQAVCQRLTTALASSDIRVLIQQDGNPALYRQRLDDLLKGSHVQDATKVKVVEHLFPSELVRLVRDRNFTSLIDKAGITPTAAEKILASLSCQEDLAALETVELVDQPRIELNDGGTWKDSKELSTGQKCTAILPILLMENEKPLLVDQPEDNLDNRYVTDKVVRTLRTVKQHRQLIFVTHNPNIPVLGDAEKVIVLDSNGTAARLVKQGTVDDCRHEIVNLLEGGREAFELRAERYHR